MSAPSVNWGGRRASRGSHASFAFDDRRRATRDVAHRGPSWEYRDAPGSSPPRKLIREWEARLAAEGLGTLDWDIGSGCIAVSERGGGKLHNAGSELGIAAGLRPAVEARRAREEYAQLARDVLDHHKFRRAIDRRVWELHAARVETPRIGRDLGITQWAARQSIARTLEAWRARRETPTEEPIDPAVGAALSEALRGCTDLGEAFERAKEIPELVDYLGDR